MILQPGVLDFSTSRKDLRRCSRSEIVLLGGVLRKGASCIIQNVDVEK